MLITLGWRKCFPSWPLPGENSLSLHFILEMQETWFQSLGWEDILEKGMATHASIPALEILWTEEPGGLQSMGVTKELEMT